MSVFVQIQQGSNDKQVDSFPWKQLIFASFIFLSTPILHQRLAQAQTDSLTFTYSSIDASAFPTVVSEVRVWDKDYLPIEGLTENDFTVFEDGIEQSPITVEGFGSDSGGVSVVLAMDASGSMEGEIDDAKAAATTFVNWLGPLDQAAVVSFYSEVHVNQTFTQNKQALIDVINALDLGSGTSVYDATVTAANLVAPIKGKKAIVLLSDGRDHNSVHTLQEAIDSVKAVGVPVYAIGLGLNPKRGRAELKAIADSSGGIFYDSPTSKELEQIYARIAFIITSYYYRISYNSANCTEDGSTRMVRIAVQHQGLSAAGEKLYRAPEHVSTLAVSTGPRPNPGQDFPVRIEAPAAGNPLFNLMQLHVRLHYVSPYLQVKSPAAQNVVPGDLFGAAGDYTYNASIDANAQTIDLVFSRNTGRGPATGSGTLAEILFTSSAETPDSARFDFSLEVVETQNEHGCPVVLELENSTLFNDGMIVWPGDTNNNGTVELTDVLVLGVYWQMAGPKRFDHSDQLAWEPHLARKYHMLDATYADADGNGIITERDLIPIGLNWRRSTAITSRQKVSGRFADPPRGAVTIDLRPGTAADRYVVCVQYSSMNVIPLTGVTFRMRYPASKAKLLEVRRGKIWRSSPLLFHNQDAKRAEIAAAVMLPAGSEAPYPNGTVIEFELQAANSLQSTDFALYDIALVDAEGQLYEPSGHAGVQALEAAIPDRFEVFPAFPNPFNPGTSIRYYLPEAASVELVVYNAAGQVVDRTGRQVHESGFHAYYWNGADQHNRPLSSGTYFIRIHATTASGEIFSAARKVLLMR